MEQTPELNKADAVLKILAAGVFLIFFNGYMIAPLIPALAIEFQTSVQHMGWVIPAYMLTYGVSTLFYGPLSDRVGRKAILLAFLTLTLLATGLGAAAWSANSLIGFRILCGVCAGGFLPISLALIGDLYPYNKLGRPMGWMFGAVAGGMSFGSTVGAWLNPVIGWRAELLCLAAGNLVVLAVLWQRRGDIPNTKTFAAPAALIIKNYLVLARSPRGSRLYALIFLNGAFHSGLFSWLGLYLVQRYQMTDAQIGTALLGYGLPGMFLGPILGRMADRFGRRLIIPLGFLLAAICALALIPLSSAWLVALIFPMLSIGMDMSHPLMTGIVSKLDPERRGQAMGLNAFAIFTGYGTGAMAFQFLLSSGFGVALAAFGLVQLALAIVAARFFRDESPN